MQNTASFNLSLRLHEILGKAFPKFLCAWRLQCLFSEYEWDKPIKQRIFCHFHGTSANKILSTWPVYIFASFSGSFFCPKSRLGHSLRDWTSPGETRTLQLDKRWRKGTASLKSLFRSPSRQTLFDCRFSRFFRLCCRTHFTGNKQDVAWRFQTRPLPMRPRRAVFAASQRGHDAGGRKGPSQSSSDLLQRDTSNASNDRSIWSTVSCKIAAHRPDRNVAGLALARLAKENFTCWPALYTATRSPI